MISKKDPEILLKKIEGEKLDKYIITVDKIFKPKFREKECRYFKLCLKYNKLKSETIIEGLFNSGRESINVKSYFDIEFNPIINLSNKKIDLRNNDLDKKLFLILSKIVEPGGKIIVAVATLYNYKLHNETFTELDRGIMAELTYIGKLLFYCGCGYRYKNWLIREGGNEGPPALQGEKALDKEKALSNILIVKKKLNHIIKENNVKYKKIAQEILMDIKTGELIIENYKKEFTS